MKCVHCGQDNPGTMAYCKRCGKKLNLSHQEVQAALKEKATKESAKNVEYQTRQILVVAVVFFILMATLKVVAAGLGPANENDFLVFVPAVSMGEQEGGYSEVPYEFQPPLDAAPAPAPPPGK